MPNRITTTSGGDDYGNPFVGPVNHTAAIVVDVSGLTDDEVDANGYLKPGVPLQKDGTLIPEDGETPGTGTEQLYGVVLEATKVADSNVGLDEVTVDVEVAVALIGAVNQDMIEDNLGRALNADEVRAFDFAGSKIALI